MGDLDTATKYEAPTTFVEVPHLVVAESSDACRFEVDDASGPVPSLAWETSTIVFHGHPDNIIKPPVTNLHEGPRLCSSPNAAREAIRTEISRWAYETNLPLLIVAIEGLAGSGKTTFQNEVKDFIGDAAPFVEIHLDDFINSARNSLLRRLKNHHPRLFWEVFSNRHSIKSSLDFIGRTGQNEGDAFYERTYDRSTGGMKPSHIHLPAGRKVIAVEGVDAIRLVHESSVADVAQVLGIFLDVSPEKSLAQAIERDYAKGRQRRREIEAFRVGEYLHMIPAMKTNRNLADIIIQQ